MFKVNEKAILNIDGKDVIVGCTGDSGTILENENMWVEVPPSHSGTVWSENDPIYQRGYIKKYEGKFIDIRIKDLRKVHDNITDYNLLCLNQKK